MNQGRRRLLLGLVLAGTPLEALPGILLRENLTASEYAALDDAFALELTGELLPDLLPGEVEAARVTWSLPLDYRTASLRARPHPWGASWRLVDDRGNSYDLCRQHGPWPPSVGFVVRLLDEARSDSLPRNAGLIRSAWEEARSRGRKDDEARSAAAVISLFLGSHFQRRVAVFVAVFFDAFRGWTTLEDDGFGEVDPGEVVQ